MKSEKLMSPRKVASSPLYRSYTIVSWCSCLAARQLCVYARERKKLKFLVVALRASNVGIPHRGERTFLNKIQYGDLIRVDLRGSGSDPAAHRWTVRMQLSALVRLVSTHCSYIYMKHIRLLTADAEYYRAAWRLFGGNRRVKSMDDGNVECLVCMIDLTRCTRDVAAGISIEKGSTNNMWSKQKYKWKFDFL